MAIASALSASAARKRLNGLANAVLRAAKTLMSGLWGSDTPHTLANSDVDACALLAAARAPHTYWQPVSDIIPSSIDTRCLLLTLTIGQDFRFYIAQKRALHYFDRGNPGPATRSEPADPEPADTCRERSPRPRLPAPADNPGARDQQVVAEDTGASRAQLRTDPVA